MIRCLNLKQPPVQTDNEFVRSFLSQPTAVRLKWRRWCRLPLTTSNSRSNQSHIIFSLCIMSYRSLSVVHYSHNVYRIKSSYFAKYFFPKSKIVHLSKKVFVQSQAKLTDYLFSESLKSRFMTRNRCKHSVKTTLFKYCLNTLQFIIAPSELPDDHRVK